MGNEVLVFSFESKNVRTLNDGDTTLFCAVDVGQALGVTARAILQRLPKKDISQADTLTSGGIQRLSFISEAGLYRAILRSDSPKADPMIDWVTREVLPAIRKQGYYLSERLKKELAEKDQELSRKEEVILRLQGKKRKAPRILATNYNVFDGHAPKWELVEVADLLEPTKTIAALRLTKAQMLGLKRREQVLLKAIGLDETSIQAEANSMKRC